MIHVMLRLPGIACTGMRHVLDYASKKVLRHAPDMNVLQWIPSILDHDLDHIWVMGGPLLGPANDCGPDQTLNQNRSLFTKGETTGKWRHSLLMVLAI